jgi:hypothetical protein
MWDPQRLTTLWASTACYKDSFTFYFTILWLGLLVPEIKIKMADTDEDQLDRAMQDITLVNNAPVHINKEL